MFRSIENPGDSAPLLRLSNAAVLLLFCVIAGFASAAPACRDFFRFVSDPDQRRYRFGHLANHP
jgi:hypothetical protein